MKALFYFICFFGATLLWSQSISDLEQRLTNESGVEKLETLNELTRLHKGSDDKKSRKFARQAYVLAKNFTKSDVLIDVDTKQIIDALNQFAVSQFERKNYSDARNIFQESQALASLEGFDKEQELSKTYLIKIDSLDKKRDTFLRRKLNEINIGNVVSNTGTNLNVAFELKMAKSSEKKDTIKAISHYEKASSLLEDLGEFEQAEEVKVKIRSLKAIVNAKDQLRQLKAIDPIRSIQNPSLPNTLSNSITNERNSANQLLNTAERLEAKKDYEGALSYYKQYNELQRRWERDSLEQATKQALVLLEVDRLKKQNEIADLNIQAIQLEKEAEIRLKQGLSIGLLIIGVAVIFVLFLYISKRKKHSLLSLAYDNLNETREELQLAKNNISKLLAQQVSPEIANALMKDSSNKKQFVSIMFLDIREFTPIAEKMEPKELIDYQNKVFGFMIDIIQKHHGNINQFMGDGFMATFGAPKSYGNDVYNSFLAGKEIIQNLEVINDKGEIPKTQVGIGIHAGEVVTGNVGTETRKQFSVTGNTVILAARIEQLNKKFNSKMIVSKDVMDHVKQEGLLALNYSTHQTHVKGRSEPIEIVVFD